MTTSPAPFYKDIATAPEGVECLWLHTKDGTRIRLAIWGAGKKGTIFLMPGRTEYIEKYGKSVHNYIDAGYSVVVIDWRGQGLADRDTPLHGVGHVDNFVQFQDDLDTALEVIKDRALPQPMFLIGHSMGGAIGLRALHRLDVFKAAVFSGPMWGITMKPALRPIAWALGIGSEAIGKSKWLAPGYSEESYTTSAEFKDNLLTGDPEMFTFLKDQLAAYPALSLGGPSVGWGYEGLRECKKLAALPAPKQPSLTVYGEKEGIVVIDAIINQVAKWPNGSLKMYENGNHETMMEVAAIREDFFARSIAFFDANS